MPLSSGYNGALQWNPEEQWGRQYEAKKINVAGQRFPIFSVSIPGKFEKEFLCTAKVFLRRVCNAARPVSLSIKGPRKENESSSIFFFNHLSDLPSSIIT